MYATHVVPIDEYIAVIVEGGNCVHCFNDFFNILISLSLDKYFGCSSSNPLIAFYNNLFYS